MRLGAVQPDLRRTQRMVAEDTGAEAEQSPASPFAVMEQVYDPETYRLLYARGIDDGWRCLEVGGGGGSIAKWLCRRVGSNGRVVVTDTDISHMAGLEEANLEIERHDVAVDPIPERVFNLVHARLVLGEVMQRDAALQSMLNSLRSGGWLVIEDLDRTSLAPDTDDPAAEALFVKVENAVAGLLTAQGADPVLGRRLFRRLTSLGLSDVFARGGSAGEAGGSPSAGLLRQELERLRDQLLASGSVTGEEIDACAALLADPGFAFMSPILVTAWGRRPSPY
jgi:SAM-dependent methyltransferase